jgi:phosphosulfolactate phosphohydrolase-like enzyme
MTAMEFALASKEKERERGAAAIVMDALCSSIIAIFILSLGLATFIEFDSIPTSVYAQQSNGIYSSISGS